MNFNGKKDARYQFKFLIFFAMLYITIDITSTALVYKKIVLFGHLTTAAIIIYPLTYILADLIAEVYGYAIVRQIIWIDLFCNFLFCITAWLLIKIPSSSHEQNQAYNIVLGEMLYIGFGSVIGGLLSDFVNVYILSRLKILFNGKLFLLRAFFASSIGMLVLLVVANIISLYKVDPILSIISISLTAYLYELVFLVLAAIPMACLVTVIKKIEAIDIYDIGLNYNPFKLDVN